MAGYRQGQTSALLLPIRQQFCCTRLLVQPWGEVLGAPTPSQRPHRPCQLSLVNLTQQAAAMDLLRCPIPSCTVLKALR